jgi:hypothetical protein
MIYAIGNSTTVYEHEILKYITQSYEFDVIPQQLSQRMSIMIML